MRQNVGMGMHDTQQAHLLRIGQMVVLSRNPDDTYAWNPGRREETTVTRVVATVAHTEELPGTATETIYETEGNKTVVHLGQPNLWKVSFIVEGRALWFKVFADTRIEVLASHHPVCADCGEPWPCREQRLDTAARQFAYELDRSCAHCGNPLGSAWSETFYDGVTHRHYHTAKKYRGPDGTPCREALAVARTTPPDNA